MHLARTSLLLVATLMCKSVAAFPTGAGACSAGNTAVQDSHLVNPTTGSLASAGFLVSLGGALIVEDSTSTFPIGTNVELKVDASNKPFLGFLIRLGETGGVSTDSAFSVTGTEIKIAPVCTAVGGVTHTSASTKSSISTTLNLAAAATAMPLDVTIVVENDGGVSEYYYSQYLLTAQADIIAAPTTPPNPGFPACEVCGAGLVITIPDGVVTPPTVDPTTCGVFAEAGLLGFVDPAFCSFLPALATNCGCSPGTEVPVVTPAPVVAPFSPAPVVITPIPIAVLPTTTPTTMPAAPSALATTMPPTAAVTPPPTPAPIVATTPGPTVAITTAPTLANPAPLTTAPVAAPAVAPVPAPIVTPVFAPVRAPVAAPVFPPVPAPVIAPFQAPIAKPVAGPVLWPTGVSSGGKGMGSSGKAGKRGSSSSTSGSMNMGMQSRSRRGDTVRFFTFDPPGGNKRGR